ncbi:hypothetical protein [Neobacillus terrae]|uniref:hypothetical protein n=1 Tax=Neobacillus terrae TaxID=3034837 RepID=UPI0014099EA2|nr:hypothetical protein [Neobacillus terrae]NHM32533.1 hypothetical protein [Neobacillus terrae]
MNKTKRVMAGITTTALLFGLSGCGANSQDATTEEDDSEWVSQPISSNNEPLAQDNIPPAPTDSECSDWEWDNDDGVWECNDSSSSHFGHYYHGSSYYGSKALLYQSKDYLTYKNSADFKGKSISSSSPTSVSSGGTESGNTSTSSGSTSSVKGSSGFGSGSHSFGG